MKFNEFIKKYKWDIYVFIIFILYMSILIIFREYLSNLFIIVMNRFIRIIETILGVYD